MIDTEGFRPKLDFETTIPKAVADLVAAAR
jgi:hypothetical protein